MKRIEERTNSTLTSGWRRRNRIETGRFLARRRRAGLVAAQRRAALQRDPEQPQPPRRGRSRRGRLLGDGQRAARRRAPGVHGSELGLPAAAQRRRRRCGEARGYGLDVVLHEVDDVVVEPLHVRQLRQQSRVAAPQPLVLRHQRRRGVGGAGASAIACGGGGEGEEARGMVDMIVTTIVMVMMMMMMEVVVVVVVVEGGEEGREMERGGRRRGGGGGGGLAALDLAEEVLLALPEELVRELPPLRHHLTKALFDHQTTNYYYFFLL